MTKKPTIKQKQFAEKYVETRNATEAALVAYDIQGEDKRKIARVIGSQNLAKLSVQEHIRAFTACTAKQVEEAFLTAIDSAVEDLKHSDSKVRNDARKVIVEAAKLFAPTQRITESRSATLNLPRRD